MSNPITFSKGENLSAAKLNSLSARTQAGQINGNVQKSKGGALFGTPDGSNFIDALRPFDVEWATNFSILVRGGAYQHLSDGDQVITKLVCDDGESSDPFDFITITPTTVGGATYYVYLELDYGEVDAGSGDSTLSARVDSFANATSYEDGIDKRILTSFTTSADNTISSFDPVDTYALTTGYYYRKDFDAISEVRIGQYQDPPTGSHGIGMIDVTANPPGTTSFLTASLGQLDLSGTLNSAAYFEYKNGTTLTASVKLCKGSGTVAVDVVGGIYADGSIGASGDISAVGDISAASYEVGGNQVVGARQATVSDPAGQVNDLDTEARTAINSIIDRLQAHGLIS